MRNVVLFMLSAYPNYTLDDVLNMTANEINILKEAYDLRVEKEIHNMHLNAWLNRAVTATNKKGDKYIYSSFDDFYKKDLGVNDVEPSKNKSKKQVVDSLSSRKSKDELFKIAENLRKYKLNKYKN